MTGHRLWLAALPLLAWSWLGAPFPATLLAWALVVAAGALTFSRAPSAWAFLFWLYATPVLGFLREGPSLRTAAGVLVAAMAFWAAGREGLPRTASAGLAALGAVLALLAAGVTTLGAQPPDFLAVLFSSRRGLLFHWPLLWAGLLGLPRARTAVASAAGVLVLLAAAASLPAARPAVALLVLPFLAAGLGASVEAVRKWAAMRPLALLGAAAVVLVAWNLLFMRLYRDERIPRDDTVAFAQVAEGGARLLADDVGSPVAWPANWLFAARHGLPPSRFDLMAGKELPAPGGRVELDVGRLDLDEALLAEGWSVRHPCGAEVCREVEGRARVFLPLPGGSWRGLALTGTGRLGVRVNGRPVGSLAATGPEAILPTPEGSWRRGLNEITLEGSALVDRLAVLP